MYQLSSNSAKLLIFLRFKSNCVEKVSESNPPLSTPDVSYSNSMELKL